MKYILNSSSNTRQSHRWFIFISDNLVLYKFIIKGKQKNNNETNQPIRKLEEFSNRVRLNVKNPVDFVRLHPNPN